MINEWQSLATTFRSFLNLFTSKHFSSIKANFLSHKLSYNIAHEKTS